MNPTSGNRRGGGTLSKPRLFVGSSREHLDTAYAVQEELERDAEVTVWTQGIFDLSKYTLDALTDTLDNVDFGVFVLAPDDVVMMRDEVSRVARDNVIFELGLFIGRLGRDRSFIFTPRGAEELHLPTDLLGITPALYDADRTDGNLVAALGPACNKVRKSLRTLGSVKPPVETVQAPAAEPVASNLVPIDAREDCLALIEAWMGRRSERDNRGAIRYADVDRELGLAPGAAKTYIVEAATRWNYVPRHLGEEVVTFEQAAWRGRRGIV
jgi:predicted nucleotide-binding protein